MSSAISISVPFPKASDVLVEGKTAVVTGASSGIGKAACVEFAIRNMNVYMLDIDEKELTQAHSEVVALPGIKGSIVMKVIDVADSDAMVKFASTEVMNGGVCHMLMNNAGIGAGGGPSTDMSVVHKVMNVNTYGPIHGCLAFYDKMKASGVPGIIVNTGSKQGITMPPGNLTYNMSKAALKCYTEGLEHDCMQGRAKGEHMIKTALLVPGWVNTSIMLKSVRDSGGDVDNVFFHENKPAKGAWMPKQIVDFMIDQLDQGKFYIICPDNDVDRQTDNLRMTWAMQDITQDRPPLSRWHPDYKEPFCQFLEENKK